MLRNLGIRSKLLGIIAVPLIVLVALSTFVVVTATGTALQADRVSRLTGTAGSLDQLVHALQAERSLSAAVLDAGGVPDAGSKRATRQLTAQRQVVDARLADVRTSIGTAQGEDVSAGFAAAVNRASRANDQIRGNRDAMDRGAAASSTVLVFYTDTIAADLAVIPLVADATDNPTLAQHLRAYASFTQLVEAAWSERDIVAIAWDRQWIRPDEYFRYVAAVSRQDDALAQFTQLAPPADVARLDAVLTSAVQTPLIDARRHVGELLYGTSPAVASTDWRAAADPRIAALTSMEPDLVSGLQTAADNLAAGARLRAVLIAAVTVAGALLLLALGGLVSRRIVEPIRRLTAATTRTAEALPVMVEQMQTPGTAPDVTLERIPVDTTDEIGQLAEAFNEVNEVTVQVAHEQAALRAGIAEMFVNVARRNQVLLGRQLTVIDRMEDLEQDPDSLERLFQVDHLATRMRRNAESLLILAGIDANRRLRQPMPLTDVIRSAVSEIESFERVDLVASLDAPVHGRLAMTVAHLLAELIENATHFSNPETRIVVATGPSRLGVDVTITDYGLGMTDAEIDAANETIAHPPIGEIAIARRLGFLVVGRLAARLGAQVLVRGGRGGGTVVTVTLPPSLFIPGTLTHVALPSEPEPEVTLEPEVTPEPEVAVAAGAEESVPADVALDVVDEMPSTPDTDLPDGPPLQDVQEAQGGDAQDVRTLAPSPAAAEVTPVAAEVTPAAAEVTPAAAEVERAWVGDVAAELRQLAVPQAEPVPEPGRPEPSRALPTRAESTPGVGLTGPAGEAADALGGRATEGEGELLPRMAVPARDVLPGRHGAPSKRRWLLGRRSAKLRRQSAPTLPSLPFPAPPTPSFTPARSGPSAAGPAVVAGPGSLTARTRTPIAPAGPQPGESIPFPESAWRRDAASGLSSPASRPAPTTDGAGTAGASTGSVPARRISGVPAVLPTGASAADALPLPPRSREVLNATSPAPVAGAGPHGEDAPADGDATAAGVRSQAGEGGPASGGALAPGGAPVRLTDPTEPSTAATQPAATQPAATQAAATQPAAPDPAVASAGPTLAYQLSVAPFGGADLMADRSALASQALSELSQLNAASYMPAAMAPGTSTLTRRVPHGGGQDASPSQPSQSGQPSQSDQPSQPGRPGQADQSASGAVATRRARDPQAVRSRLNEFRAGVARGRSQGDGRSPQPGAGGARSRTGVDEPDGE